MILNVLPETLTICRYAPNQPFTWHADWLSGHTFFSLTRTADEISLICLPSQVPDGYTKMEPNWRAMKIEGMLDFGLVGILAQISVVLAEAAVSIFAISTYNTDYILVKAEQLLKAVQALRAAEYEIENFPFPEDLET